MNPDPAQSATVCSAPNNPNSLFKRKVGALWTRTGRSGNKYLSGKVKVGGSEVSVLVVKNDRKEQEKHPDYEIFLMREEVTPKELPL